MNRSFSLALVLMLTITAGGFAQPPFGGPRLGGLPDPFFPGVGGPGIAPGFPGGNPGFPGGYPIGGPRLGGLPDPFFPGVGGTRFAPGLPGGNPGFPGGGQFPRGNSRIPLCNPDFPDGNPLIPAQWPNFGPPTIGITGIQPQQQKQDDSKNHPAFLDGPVIVPNFSSFNYAEKGFAEPHPTFRTPSLFEGAGRGGSKWIAGALGGIGAVCAGIFRAFFGSSNDK